MRLIFNLKTVNLKIAELKTPALILHVLRVESPSKVGLTLPSEPFMVLSHLQLHYNSVTHNQ